MLGPGCLDASSRELQGYYAIMTELSSHLMCRAEGELAVDFVIPHPGWARLVQQLARIYWLFLNLLPYVRGSSTAGRHACERLRHASIEWLLSCVGAPGLTTNLGLL